MNSVYVVIEGRARGHLQATRRNHMCHLLPHPTERDQDSLKKEAESGAQEMRARVIHHSAQLFTPRCYLPRVSFVQLKGYTTCRPTKCLFDTRMILR